MLRFLITHIQLPLTLLSSAAVAATTTLMGSQAVDVLSQNKVTLLTLLWCAAVAVFAYLSNRRYPVLLLDYSCYKPDDEQKCSYETSEYFIRRSRRYNTTSEEFMRAIYLKSGLGNETYAPPFLFRDDGDATLAPALQEVEAGMFSAVDALLAKTHVEPSQIDVLVVACSMFAPCPSLTSLLVGRYGCRPSVKTFNLSGMGCSAGTIAVDMAAKILRRKPGYALIVTTESTSLNWYYGDNRNMLVTNCIFRVGAAAMLLTSDPSRREESKLELVRSLRTHHGADDASYGAAVQQEDESGTVGVALNKDLVRVAGAGLREHIRALAPFVLPLSELLRYAGAVAVSAVKLSIMGGTKAGAAAGAAQANVPDFTKAFEHMCFHPGGKAVINTLGRLMRLPEGVVEPARMTLHRFGNTSSSSVLYELAYFEAKQRIRRGDRLWMLAFGTGFKACSLVWKATRDCSRLDSDNPWADCVHAYPVRLQAGVTHQLGGKATS